MDGFMGYSWPWAGFVDYSKCYHDVKITTILIQSVIILGAVASMLPQVIKPIQRRTSHGLSGLFGLLTGLGHYFVVTNYFCLHNADFVGLLQIPLSQSWTRFLTITNYFAIFILFLPIYFLIIQLFDKAPRKNFNASTNRKIFVMTVGFLLIYFGTVFTCWIIFYFLGTHKGFHSRTVHYVGQVYGTASVVFSVIHYLPQFVTTCRLKSEGSLSIIMLAIQAPGGILSSMIMAFGQNEHWTTFSCMLVASSEQLLLLVLCLYYKCCYKRHFNQKPLLEESTSTSHMNENVAQVFLT